jgi:hypothetical protein
VVSAWSTRFWTMTLSNLPDLLKELNLPDFVKGDYYCSMYGHSSHPCTWPTKAHSNCNANDNARTPTLHLVFHAQTIFAHPCGATSPGQHPHRLTAHRDRSHPFRFSRALQHVCNTRSTFAHPVEILATYV